MEFIFADVYYILGGPVIIAGGFLKKMNKSILFGTLEKLKDIMIQTLKQNIIPFIECCILSSEWILVFLYSYNSFFQILTGLSMREDVQIGHLNDVEIYFTLFSILFFVFNLMIYSFLKKKYNFKMKIFFYGIGITSCFLVYLVIFQSRLEILGYYEGGIPWQVHTIYAFSLTLLYYSYVAMLQSNNKGTDKIALYLKVLTIIPFVGLIIIEIIGHRISILGFSLLFVIGFVWCLIFMKVRFNLRIVAWCLFFPAYASLFLDVLSSPLL